MQVTSTCVCVCVSEGGRGATGACQWSKVPLVKDELYEVFYDVLVHKFHAVLDGGFGNVEVFQFCH